MDLSRGKAVRCGKLDSPLDFRSLTTVSKSRHTRQQRIDSKIYRIEFEDVVALHLHCNFYCLVFSRCREMRAKLHRQSTHTSTVCLWGSAHRSCSKMNRPVTYMYFQASMVFLKNKSCLSQLLSSFLIVFSSRLNYFPVMVSAGGLQANYGGTVV